MSRTYGRILPRTFYARDAITVARDLIGKNLVKGETAGTIIETEAYPGGDDLASHSAAGITKRTTVIFGPPGHAYVYLCYGMYYCMNVVTQPEGTAGCVLIRALKPVSGLDRMRERRRSSDLTSGPGKLTMALGIGSNDYGVDLTRGDFTIREAVDPVRLELEVTPRIGISRCADLPYRFVAR